VLEGNVFAGSAAEPAFGALVDDAPVGHGAEGAGGEGVFVLVYHVVVAFPSVGEWECYDFPGGGGCDDVHVSNRIAGAAWGNPESLQGARVYGGCGMMVDLRSAEIEVPRAAEFVNGSGMLDQKRAKPTSTAAGINCSASLQCAADGAEDLSLASGSRSCRRIREGRLDSGIRCT
jgi:hypothetical protein